jgi:hypothetical protein
MEIWYKTHCPTCRATNWTPETAPHAEFGDGPADICKCWGCGTNYLVDEQFSWGFRNAIGSYGDGTPYETLAEYVAVAPDAVLGKQIPD